MLHVQQDGCAQILVRKHLERMPKHSWEDNSEMDFEGL